MAAFFVYVMLIFVNSDFFGIFAHSNTYLIMLHRLSLITVLAALICLFPSFAVAQTADKAEKKTKVINHLKEHYRPYGFIRNYFTYDSRESVSGHADMFNYVPKDFDWNMTEAEAALSPELRREDMNAVGSFRFLSLTTRLGLNIVGYEWGKTQFSGKIEADFYAGLTGVTGVAQFRLRLAYLTLAWDSLSVGKEWARVSLTLGQDWHPMAADLCDVLSLNTGAPFSPFSRTPQVRMEARLTPWFMLSAAALWQMQYVSAGPKGMSADYIKYSKTPEAYLGLNFMHSDAFLLRLGVDMLSISPRHEGTVSGSGGQEVRVRVNDRLTTVSPFAFMRYSVGDFSVKVKTIFAESGEHMSLCGGYGVSKINADGSWEYTPTRNSSTWISLTYGRQVKGVLFAGYVQNFGTKTSVVDADHLYFNKNMFASIHRLWRLSPALVWTIGPFQLGAEYELTSAQYGTGTMDLSKGLFMDNLHWVYNHRVQLITKFNF